MDEDELEDRELPDPSDMDQDDYTVMSRCPHCKKMIDEQSEVCPLCGMFITSEDENNPPTQGFPLWIIVIVVLAMLIVVLGAASCARGAN